MLSIPVPEFLRKKFRDRNGKHTEEQDKNKL